MHAPGREHSSQDPARHVRLLPGEVSVLDAGELVLLCDVCLLCDAPDAARIVHSVERVVLRRAAKRLGSRASGG